MADPEHLRILKQGVEEWNSWRGDVEVRPDLRGANLRGANLRAAYLEGANLSEADLREATLFEAHLFEADLSGADLSRADLSRADLRRANLSEANLRAANLRAANLHGAYLSRANLRVAHLEEANLCGADLTFTNLVDASLTSADLTASRVYGISAWNVELVGANQSNIVITPPFEPEIQVDRLNVAQFIYLLLNNSEIRHVIDTITSKVVLILGRFTEQRKSVLDAMRSELRKRDYLPILFEWEKPSSRDITETVSTLAHMAKFVIADITDAKSIPQELSVIIPNLPSVPVQPLLLGGQREYGMFEHWRHYPWVLPLAFYNSEQELLGTFEQKVLAPAETKLRELRGQQPV
jgi:hypothetical protein